MLVFVAALSVLTELAAAAGLLTVVATMLLRWGRGRAWRLWLLAVTLAVTSTAFLCLDTTAVLLTPVVVVMARQVSLSPWPFALSTIWLADTASLWLLVSNLTSLLAASRLQSTGPGGFLALMAAPAAVAVVCIIVLAVLHRRDLRVTHAPHRSTQIQDRGLLLLSAAVVALLIPALVSRVPVWLPAVSAAVVLVLAFARRRPSVRRLRLVPWPLLVFAFGLFLAAEAAHGLGLGDRLGADAGPGESVAELFRLLGASVAGANTVSNLPADLALEPLADTPLRLTTVLIGVNAGPLLTPWASLATLLWADRLRALHVAVDRGPSNEHR